MQVEAKEDKQRGEPGMRWDGTSAHGRAKGKVWSAGDKKSRERAKQSEAQIVQSVMVLGEPQQRTGRVSRQEFRDDAEAVKIGYNGSGNDESFFAMGEQWLSLRPD